MSVLHRIRCLARELGRCLARRHTAGRRPSRSRCRPLLLDLLEDRVLLSTFTEVEPNGSATQANAVTVPVADVLAAPATGWLNISGQVSSSTESDYFRFTLAARSGVFFDIDARETGLSTTLNSLLRLYDSTGATQLASNDNGYDPDTNFPAPAAQASSSSADSSLYLDLNAGTYLVRVSSVSSTTGTYQLRLLADTSYTSTVPALNSLPGATDTLLLDFNGHAATDNWGTYSIPAYDFNGNGAEFSPAERLAIRNTWRVVAEDFSPFRLNVSTNYAGSFSNGVGFRQVIGNSNGSQIGVGTNTLGIAFIGSYAGGGTNTAFTFASNFSTYSGGGISGQISAKPLVMANVSSHEFGHALGLEHYTNQSIALLNTPSTGLARATWFTGTNTSGNVQNDLAIIASAINTFGYRADDHGSSRTTARVLTPSGGVYTASGVVEQLTDLDYFRFTASGTTTIKVDVDEYVNDLDVELRLFDANGNLIATSDPGTSFDGSLTLQLGAGTYYIEVRSDGGAGEVGQYNVRITTTP